MANIKKPVIKRPNISVQKYRRNLIIIFISAVFLLDIVLTSGISYYAGKTMNKKISMLMNANTYQQAMNVESYFSTVKDTVSLFFSDKVYYEYDATKEMSDIERLEAENIILDRIQNLGVLENFADFGVIYANNSTVGWISEGMFEMLANDEMYTFFSSNITDSKTESGWFCTQKNNYDRIYYVKRINENAVLVASIFSNELSSIFNTPDELKGMDIRLADENKNVIYSVNSDEIGKPLDPKIEKLVYSGSSVSDNENIVSSLFFDINDWCIICSLPESIISEDITNLKMFAHIFALLMMIIVGIAGYISLYRASNPLSELVSSLADKAEHDQLTGVLNKISFKTAAEALRQKEPTKTTSVFIMLDMDNFKLVNDTLGHTTGDDILSSFAKLVRQLFESEYIIGRLGGDEFALFTLTEEADKEALKTTIAKHLEVLRTEFLKQYKEYNESCGLSLSAGAYISTDKDISFDTMYKTADNALYDSKNMGKNTYTVK